MAKATWRTPSTALKIVRMLGNAKGDKATNLVAGSDVSAVAMSRRSY